MWDIAPLFSAMMTTSSDDCWYCEIDKPSVLDQGQILFDFVVFEVESTATPPSLIEERTGTFIIATQSCDTGDANDLLVVAVNSAKSMGLGKDKLTAIAKGNRPLYHLLPPHHGFDITDYLVCDFAHFVVVPRTRVLEFIGSKSPVPHKVSIRLLSPYREQFSSALGAVFSRVAIQQNTWERTDFGT